MAAVTHLRPVPNPADELSALFEEHHDQVFRAAYRVTGNAEDAEDVLQTVFLRLARREEPIDLSPNPGSYLYRAAINASLDLVRRRKRVVTTSIEDLDLQPTTATPGPEDQHEGRELQGFVRDSVSQLSAGAAEVFVLRYFEGYKNHEIAEMLGKSRMSVTVLMHRARTQVRNDLRTYLGRHHESES